MADATTTPRLKGDWEGRHVRLNHEIKNGHTIFPAGEIMKVTRNYGGLHLEAVHACDNCRLRHRHSINRVRESTVTLLPPDYPLGSAGA